MDAAVTPLPTEETTPPVQKRYFVTLTSLSGFREIGGCHPVAQHSLVFYQIMAYLSTVLGQRSMQ
jgi:hypothetical protein